MSKRLIINFQYFDDMCSAQLNTSIYKPLHRERETRNHKMIPHRKKRHSHTTTTSMLSQLHTVLLLTISVKLITTYNTYTLYKHNFLQNE